MNEEKIQEFNEFFQKNYRYLQGFTKSINPQHFYNDTLNDVYLKCRDRIEVNGYQGTDYLNFVRVALMNTYKSQYRCSKKKQLVDFEDSDYRQTIEEILLIEQQQQQQERELEHRDTYLNTMVFQFIEETFNAKEQFVFKTYFLLKHKKLNYKQLAEVTGYSITSVSNIIKMMKKKINLELGSYINSGQTINV